MLMYLQPGPGKAHGQHGHCLLSCHCHHKLDNVFWLLQYALKYFSLVNMFNSATLKLAIYKLDYYKLQVLSRQHSVWRHQVSG